VRCSARVSPVGRGRGSMAFEDLRLFLDACQEIDELRVLQGADWDLEIGALAELNFEIDGPCLLFDNIKGYPPGYRVAVNIQDTRRRALLSVDLPIRSGARRAQLRDRWPLSALRQHQGLSARLSRRRQHPGHAPTCTPFG